MTSRLAVRTAGLAGVGYVVFAGVENLDLPDQPGLNTNRAAVTDYFAGNPAALRLGVAVGAVSLACFAAFVVALWRATAGGARWGRGLLLGGGLAAVTLGAVQLVLRVGIIADPSGADPYPYLRLRLAAGLLIGVVVAGAAQAAGAAHAAAGRALLPRSLAGLGLAIAPFVGAASIAALASDRLHAVSLAGFVAAAGWLGAAAVALLLPPDARADGALAWLAFFAVSVAAGVSGVALLAFPGSTGSYFSWPLAPPSLAATIGACYLAAAACYGLALAKGRYAERGPLVGMVALSAPVFVITLAHLDAFHFGRWQAWAWVVLFGAFPVVAVAALWWGRRRREVARRRPAYGLLAYGVLALGTAVAFWSLPSLSPIDAGAFGVRVLGAWFCFGGALALWASLRSVTLPLRVALVLLPLAWALGPLRSDPVPRSVLWYAGLGVLLMLAVTVRGDDRPVR